MPLRSAGADPLAVVHDTWARTGGPDSSASCVFHTGVPEGARAPARPTDREGARDPVQPGHGDPHRSRRGRRGLVAHDRTCGAGVHGGLGQRTDPTPLRTSDEPRWDGRIEPLDPFAAAEAAGLLYVNNTIPGIRSERVDAHCVYRHPERARRSTTRPNDGASTRSRSRRRGPTCGSAPIADGHLQATGRDAKGRKQYRYHPDWRVQQEEDKYSRLIDFAAALPVIRKQVAADYRLPGIPRAKVLAASSTCSSEPADPGGQRRVRQGERLVRADDPARPARALRRRRHALRVHGQEREAARGHRARRPHRADRPLVPRHPGSAAVPVPRRRRQARRRRLGRRQRVSARRGRRGLHRQGLPHVGWLGHHGRRGRRARSAALTHRCEAQDRQRHRRGRRSPQQPSAAVARKSYVHRVPNRGRRERCSMPSRTPRRASTSRRPRPGSWGSSPTNPDDARHAQRVDHSPTTAAVNRVTASPTPG